MAGKNGDSEPSSKEYEGNKERGEATRSEARSEPRSESRSESRSEARSERSAERRSDDVKERSDDY